MPPFVSSPRLNSVQRASGRRMRTMLLTGACITALVVGQARAGGVSGGNVVYGNASINYGSKNTTISQSTQKALINWNSFSIASGSSVSFLQPNSSSITLNRVLGGSPSVIDGSLFATGNVWLINSNGVLFGKGSQINVGGLIATTSDMRNSDFISGNYNFSVASPNPNASVVNQGTIKTARGGTAILAGSSVNNQGLIQADMGNVVLGRREHVQRRLHRRQPAAFRRRRPRSSRRRRMPTAAPRPRWSPTAARSPPMAAMC